MTRIIKLNRQDVFEIPCVPNFIRRKVDDFAVPYGELTDAEIRKVGKAWTANLLKRAKEQRKNRTEFDLAPRKGKGEI